jgi:hypothetical protein
VTGRALVFSNPEIIQLIKTEFVSYAGDQWYLHRQKDAAGQFFWKVAQQGHLRNSPEDSTRQGIYTATAEGVCLGSINHPSPERNLALFREALRRFRETGAATKAVRSEAPADARYVRRPPEDGLIVDVFSRIPLPAKPGMWDPNQATGRDHLWLTAAERRSLLPKTWREGERYAVPSAVVNRMIRFHLLDNVRGEPNYWAREHIQQAEMTLTVESADTGTLRLEGVARMQRGNAQGYDARLQGVLQCDRKQGRFTRFDILAWGEAWGEGTYTGGAPKGKFPLVIALSLVGNRPADRIPPQASRELGTYFATDQNDS